SVSRSVVNDLVTNFLPSKRFFQWVQAKVVLGEGEFVPKPGNNTDAFLNKFLQNADKHASINSIRGKRLAHAENQYYGGNDYDITGNPISYSAWDVSTRFPIMEEKKLADLMRYAMSGDAAVYTADNQEIPFKDLPYEQQLIYKHPTLSWTYFYGQAFHVEQDGRLQTVYVEGWPESMH